MAGKAIDSQAVFMEEAIKAAEEVQKKETMKPKKKVGLLSRFLRMFQK